MNKKRDRLARQAVFVLGIGSLAGVLIWSKLRLVTDIPRSAYAVPEQGEPSVTRDGSAPNTRDQVDLAPQSVDPAGVPRAGLDLSVEGTESGLADPAGGAPPPDPAATDDPRGIRKDD